MSYREAVYPSCDQMPVSVVSVEEDSSGYCNATIAPHQLTWQLSGRKHELPSVTFREHCRDGELAKAGYFEHARKSATKVVSRPAQPTTSDVSQW